MAHISEDEALIRAFKNNEDIHSATAREVFGKADPDTRRMAKTINFGIIYGQSAFSLAAQLGISNHEARHYIDAYFEKYSGLKKWMTEIAVFARKNGYVKTLLGRIRYLPEINSSNANVRGNAERMAMNTPIQGTSADIIKVAMVKLYEVFDEKKYKAKMLVQVHDELLFEIPENEVHIVSGIKDIMENSGKNSAFR